MRRRRKSIKVCRVCNQAVATNYGNYKKHLISHLKCKSCGGQMESGRLVRYGVCKDCGLPEHIENHERRAIEQRRTDREEMRKARIEARKIKEAKQK